ncbi:Ubiquitin-like protein [Orchesella cincta]|uniref:Ubiquitin-like protein n=1 Tax=Orchesella cincta TaxID=48709 RepID=A0A1D2ML10_ORCCI|nr:Ubiquitin-like protein [Orchesella cincta]
MDPGKGKVPSKGNDKGQPSRSAAVKVRDLLSAMTLSTAERENSSTRRLQESSVQVLGATGSSADELSIKIRSLDGKTTAIQAKRCWTVKKLKEAFAEYRGDGWENVVMLYRGRRLQDEELLSKYNIEPDTFIQANFRSKGGYFHCAMAGAQKQSWLAVGSVDSF